MTQMEDAVIQLITPEHHQYFTEPLHQMHRLRCRVFKERLDWGVEVREGLEVDRFDGLRPVYLLQRASDACIQGCVRLLPTTGSTMLRDVFPELLDGKAMPAGPDVWESSRFAVDMPAGNKSPSVGLSQPTFELFAGMIEFGLSRSLIDIVTVTDLRVERILRRASWPLRRIAEPRTIGSTTAVAGYLEISIEALASVRLAGEIGGPVLWTPVLGAST
jgi:acyl homoserine lactone synthase